MLAWLYQVVGFFCSEYVVWILGFCKVVSLQWYKFDNQSQIRLLELEIIVGAICSPINIRSVFYSGT